MDATREDRLVILLTFLRRTPAQDDWIRANVDRVADWDGFVRTADDNRVVPMVHWQLDALGLLDRVPEPHRSRLDSGAAQMAAVNEARLAAGRDVLAALRARGQSEVPSRMIGEM